MIFTVWEKGRETMNKITGNTSVAEIVKLCPNTRHILRLRIDVARDL